MPLAQCGPSPSSAPVDLGCGLSLHAVRDAPDAERVAAFNASVHQDEAVGVFTRWKLGGTHPTVTFSDCLFVEDTRSGEIVSSLCLLPQTWTYEGIPLVDGHPVSQDRIFHLSGGLAHRVCWVETLGTSIADTEQAAGIGSV